MRRRSAAIALLCVTMGRFFGAFCAARETDFRGWEHRVGLHAYLVQDAPLWVADLRLHGAFEPIE